jgi:hypothetical protein
MAHVEISAADLIAHVRMLEDTAHAHRMMRADLEDLEQHLGAMAVSYSKCANDPNAGENLIWYQGKAQAYGLASSKLREILEQ